MSLLNREEVKFMSRSKNGITIRLYRQIDIDLIYLYESLIINGQSEVIQRLVKELIRKGILREPLSENGYAIYQSLMYPDSGQTPLLRYKIQIRISMEPKEDSEIINWLNSIRPGYKNSAVKSMIRAVLGEPCLFPSYASTELNIINSTKQKG